MSILGQRIRDELPSGMALPAELDRLLAWCEQRGWCDELDGPLPTVTPYPVDADVTTARFTTRVRWTWP